MEAPLSVISPPTPPAAAEEITTSPALPADPAQFRQLQQAMRRMGRIIEGNPSNIAETLRGRNNLAGATWLVEGTITGITDLRDASQPKVAHAYMYGTQPVPYASSHNPYTEAWGTAPQHAYPGMQNQQTTAPLPYGQPHDQYSQWQEDDEEAYTSGTDTDTQSSVGETTYDTSDMPTGRTPE